MLKSLGQFLSAYYLFFLLIPIYGTSIAITIDDHPMPEGPLFSVEKRTEKLIEACQAHQIKAAFFCVGKYCKTQPGISSLLSLDKQGHFLANHSMTHPHLSALSLTEFENEIKETDSLLMPYPNMRKWFRYPFLDYGNQSHLGGSKKKAIDAYTLMQKLGHKEGYVTINTFDWHINGRLQQAIKEKKNINYPLLKELYLHLVKEWCTYYTEIYEDLFEEEIIHTLLLHANDLNALYLQDILQMLNQSGWKIVSPELAMQSIDWRKKIFEGKFLITKPYTLNCQVIDDLIDHLPLFTLK